MNERHSKILEVLGKGEVVSVKQMTDMLAVSSVTIRQDLNHLEAEGLLKRVHGGAIINDTDNIAHRMGIHYEQKLAIARKALAYINEGETILIESGSLNAILAKELVKFNSLTVITTNIYIAQQMRRNPNIKIIIPGGMYQHESESIIGQLAKTGLDKVNFSKAFIGVDGFTQDSGFTSKDMFRAEISSHIVLKKSKTYVLTDSSKFGHSELSKICDTDKVDYIITDNSLPPSYKTYFEKMSMQLITA